MFDRSLLPHADLEFVVVGDTHYMLDVGSEGVELESRKLQTARAENALRHVASLDADFVVHLGDLVQEFPESAGFEQAMGEALEQLRRCRVSPKQVAGNHELGDKPDPTMPTDWVTADVLSSYHERFGPSWYSWDEAGCHFVVLNSQIMNGPLPEEAEQKLWLERDLADYASKTTFVFMHLSPFLVDEDEPYLGHYDNVAEPTRGWLLDLLRKYDVRMLFSGHSHFAFFNLVGDTSAFVVPSTSFTRPGFCEVFSGSPPPDRGRDDAQKLGFYLIRVLDGEARAHFVRTRGDTSPIDESSDERRILTRVPRDLPDSPLGITLRHPLTTRTEVPIAWQSVIRQPVRNDYPLLSCTELGARFVRVPASDLKDETQRRRLMVLRAAGVEIIAFWLWSEHLDLPGEVAASRDLLDGVEMQTPGVTLPGEDCLRAIQTCREEEGLPVTLAVLLPKEAVAGKQHPRTRIGYVASELRELDEWLAERNVSIDRVLCRIGFRESPWETICGGFDLAPPDRLERIGAVDWAIELPERNQRETDRDECFVAAEALHAVATNRGSRLFIEPLVEFDRTMDIPCGLLDRLHNPRPVFDVVRVLNSALSVAPRPLKRLGGPETEGARIFGLQGTREKLWLILHNPSSDTGSKLDPADLKEVIQFSSNATLIDLERATSRTLAHDETASSGDKSALGAITLLRIEEG